MRVVGRAGGPPDRDDHDRGDGDHRDTVDRGAYHDGPARAAPILGSVGTTLWLAFLGPAVLGASAA